MNMRLVLGFALALGLIAETSYAASPVVSNVRSSQRPGTKLVDIYYDVSDADGGSETVEVNVSGDEGQFYVFPSVTLSGQIGSGVALGSDRHIVWDARAHWNGNYVVKTIALSSRSTKPFVSEYYKPIRSAI